MTDRQTPQQTAAALVEVLVDEHGADADSAVGWFRGDAAVRYRVMLDVIRDPARPRTTLLDFGCGLGGLLDYINGHGLHGLGYAGLDISAKMISLARQRHPEATFYCLDMLDSGEQSAVPVFDYVVMNGVFTYRAEHSEAEMLDYLRALVPRVFEHCAVGLAFNVHTKQVDWERDDLFHLPVDTLLDFLAAEVSRHVVIRHDYGLYEYTAYVYRDPSDITQRNAKRVVTRRE